NVNGLTYDWTVPAGVTIVSGQGTHSLTVNFPSVNFNGSIAVTATNACATSIARTLSVKAAPSTPASINGPATVCPGSTGGYYITAVTSASSYTWTGPSGSHVTGNGVTSSSNVLTTPATSVTINFGSVTSSSTIKVKASNGCAASA